MNLITWLLQKAGKGAQPQTRSCAAKGGARASKHWLVGGLLRGFTQAQASRRLGSGLRPFLHFSPILVMWLSMLNLKIRKKANKNKNTKDSNKVFNSIIFCYIC